MPETLIDYIALPGRLIMMLLSLAIVAAMVLIAIGFVIVLVREALRFAWSLVWPWGIRRNS